MVVPQHTILAPGAYWDTAAGLRNTNSGVGGLLVIAFSGTQLDGTGQGVGLPAGFALQQNPCEPVAGHTAVFTCRTGPGYQRPPQLVVTRDTADMTTAYQGYAYVPQGGDLAAGVEAALSASTRPADATHGVSTAVVKTREHAERNTVGFTVPDVPAGGSARHEMRLHAPDGGRIYVQFGGTDGQLPTRGDRLTLSGLQTDSGAACTLDNPQIGYWHSIRCTLEPGDHSVSYTINAPADAKAFTRETIVWHDIYSPGVAADVVESVGAFDVKGAPVLPRHYLLARDGTGRLYSYEGSGIAARPFFERRSLTGDGIWNAYNTLTLLSPFTESLVYNSTPPVGAARGRGDLVARDANGVLWYFDRQFTSGGPYAPRVKAGTGWNIYDRIAGAGDVDRDGYMDLLARDQAGVLWLYRGTGSFTTARFKARVKVGTGWSVYTQLAGGADLTGDGRADLLARDRAGVLWLYRGTGSGTAPYGARVKLGGGWNTYNQLTVAGDLTDDGKADAIGRDTTGNLWLYPGTGKTTTLFGNRIKVGTGWNTYNRVL